MSLKTARILAALYFVAMAVAVTWPGALVSARIEPLVFQRAKGRLPWQFMRTA